METITKKTLQIIMDEIKASNRKYLTARAIIFNHVSKSDIVPLELCDTFKKIIFRFYYDKTGYGYNGIINEVEKRLYTMKRTEKTKNIGGVPVKEFLLHTMKETDTIDTDNHIGYEEKSGCGDWLRSESPDFETVIKEYSRKKTRIRWDYTFTVETKKEGIQEYSVYIDTTWKNLFRFLSEYNDKGLKTWFKENAKSGLSGLYIWEMNTIRTSRAKAEYLVTFDEWESENN